MLFRSFIVLLALVIPAAPALAQDEDGQIWTTTSAELGIGEDWTLATQFVARFGDDANGPSELQYAIDGEYETSGGLTIAGGYSYVTAYDQGDIVTREHRVRQTVSAPLGSLLGGEVEGRARLEQRWRDDGDDVMLRLRARLAWTREIGPEGLAVRLSQEGFAHLNETDWGGGARFDRLRGQALLRRDFGEVVTGELGYTNQWSFGGDGPDEIIHAATIGLSFCF